MKIIINQNKLISAIRLVERVVSKNISLPILNTILLKTEGGQLQLIATNLEIGIHCSVGVKIEKEGSVAVPAKIFSDFISNVHDEKIILGVDKNIISVISEHYKTQILGMKPDEFPIVPTVRNAIEFTMPSKELSSALTSVFDATSLMETRPELSGVFIHNDGKTVTFAATDSFRLSERIVKVATNAQKSFIIPRATALEMIHLSADHQEDVKIIVSENQIALRGSNFELVSRLIDGRYPDYKKVIPEKFIATVTVDKAEFERNVRMASIFSSSISDLTIKASNATLQVMAKNSDKGEIVSNLASSGVKEPFDVSVNYRYLLDGLKTIPTSALVIGYSGQGSPLVLQGEQHEGQVYVIMPLRA